MKPMTLEDVQGLLAQSKQKGQYRIFLSNFEKLNAPGVIANDDFPGVKAPAMLQSLKLNAEKHFPGKFRIVNNDGTILVFNRAIVEGTSEPVDETVEA